MAKPKAKGQTREEVLRKKRENERKRNMDFSENFSTKYGEEIQSFHFGGSRAQISLHTVVVYLKNSKRSYCTVSNNLSHNVPAIWAHLQPVLEELLTNIENIHFLSDGPVTQYQNKLMFYILACKMSEMRPNFMTWTWNYHEAGHGKGAPDGVGATCKRTADSVVASGGDVADLAQFCSAIQDRCPNITLFRVTDNDIERMNRLISRGQPNLLSSRGTLQVHQVQENAYLPQKVVMKSLSCFCSSECEHYRLGTVKYSTTPKTNVDSVFGESDSETSDDRNKKKLTDDEHEEDKKDLFKTTKTEKKQKVMASKKRSKSSKKKKANEKKKYRSELEDCCCIVCGASYKEDTTGQDWIQCIVCHDWAQINCIRTDPVSFTCPECLPDSDYEQ